MSQDVKRISTAVLAAALVALAAGTGYCEENTKGNSLTGFFKKLFNYPPKAVQKTGEMTANTLNNTGDKVLSDTGEKLAEGKPIEAVGETVSGTAETVGQTASETVQIPVKAAEDEPQAQTTPATT